MRIEIVSLLALGSPCWRNKCIGREFTGKAFQIELIGFGLNMNVFGNERRHSLCSPTKNFVFLQPVVFTLSALLPSDDTQQEELFLSPLIYSSL